MKIKNIKMVVVVVIIHNNKNGLLSMKVKIKKLIKTL